MKRNKKISEKDFEAEVKEYITSVGGWWFKVWGNAFTRNGVPDLLCCINGRFFGIELKSSTGEPSKLQEREVALIKSAGGISGIYYPKDFDKLKEEIQEVLRR